MAEEQGVPARQLSDEDLERQGVRAHATRHWVFLHGTAEQFRTHTQRMLELEQEYLRRHPQRTWQGSGGAGTVQAAEVTAIARDARIRDVVRTLTSEVLALLDDPGNPPPTSWPPETPEAQSQFLTAFAAAPNGRMHKLEAHQLARAVGSTPQFVASLYKQDPPLLRAEGDQRVITVEGRAWLDAHAAP